MNSGLRPPASGNFSLGVWENLGADPSNLIGTTRAGTDQKRTLILAKDHNAYSEKFTIDQYDELGNLLALAIVCAKNA